MKLVGWDCRVFHDLHRAQRRIQFCQCWARRMPQLPELPRLGGQHRERNAERTVARELLLYVAQSRASAVAVFRLDFDEKDSGGLRREGGNFSAHGSKLEEGVLEQLAHGGAAGSGSCRAESSLLDVAESCEQAAR
jgi:hypothetical protein